VESETESQFIEQVACDKFQADKKECLKWIQLASEEQHPMAMYYLGHCYHSGLDGLLEKSQSKAFSLIEQQAAKRGASQSHNLLGALYLFKENEMKAYNHFTISYGYGCKMASLIWGLCSNLESEVLVKISY
jgi:TPR repeat protein